MTFLEKMKELSGKSFSVKNSLGVLMCKATDDYNISEKEYKELFKHFKNCYDFVSAVNDITEQLKRIESNRG